MANRFHGRSRLLWLLLVVGMAGCDAFEYYGPLPNLRHALTVNLRELGRLESLEIRRQTLTQDAAKELRLINTVHRVSIEDSQFIDSRTLLESLGELSKLEALTLRRCNFSDSDLAGLAEAINLQELDIVGVPIDGSGLAALSGLPLRSLTLHAEQATARTLSDLKSLSSLEELTVRAPLLELDQLSELRHLKRLKVLRLDCGEFSNGGDRELRYLRDLTELREITLASPSVDESVLQTLGQMPALIRIELPHTQVTNQGIEALAGLHQLQCLRIWRGERLTAECLPHLMKLQALEEISLCGALISRTEAQQLDQLPAMRDRDVGMSRWELAEAQAQRARAEHHLGRRTNTTLETEFQDPSELF